MNKTIATIIGASLALSVNLPSAMADDEAVSGISKDRNNTLEVSGPGFGITGVSSSKKDSSPCKVSINERALSGGANSSNEPNLNACPGRATRVKETAKFDDPNVFVNGIAVCLTKKLKHLRPVLAGVRLSGARVEGGNVTPLDEGSDVSFARQTCANWYEPVNCGEGQIATGLTVHFRLAKQSDFQIVGLGLVCEAPA